MAIIREYSSISELLKSIDDTVAEYRRVLGELLKKTEELRVKSEQEAKLRAVLSKLGAPVTPPSSTEIGLRSIKLVINPLPQQELSLIEVAVEALNNKITALTSIKKDIEALSALGDVGIKITVIYVDDVPKNIILKFA